MKQASPFNVLYSELTDQLRVGRLNADFPPDGVFVKKTDNNRTFWYYQEPLSRGRRQKYVGPDSEQLQDLIRRHGNEKESFKERRKIVKALQEYYGVNIDGISGEILIKLAEAGVFRLRSVVVGTTAYQTYGPMLGVKLRSNHMQTGDLDIAQFSSISIHVNDVIDRPIIDILKEIDRDFEPVVRAFSKRVTQYHLRAGFRLDILTPNEGPDRDEPIDLPALQASGVPMRFLDFLINGETQAAILYGGGILVNVPRPARYAVHKLIVSQSRQKSSVEKIKKDLNQAYELIEHLHNFQPYDLEETLSEAWDRGPEWRRKISAALRAGGPIPVKGPWLDDARVYAEEPRHDEPVDEDNEILGWFE